MELCETLPTSSSRIAQFGGSIRRERGTWRQHSLPESRRGREESEDNSRRSAWVRATARAR